MFQAVQLTHVRCFTLNLSWKCQNVPKSDCQFFFQFFFHWKISMWADYEQLLRAVFFMFLPPKTWKNLHFFRAVQILDLSILHKGQLLQDWVSRLGVSPKFFSIFHRLWYVNLSGGFKKGHLINSGLMVFWVGWHADGTIGLIPFWRSLFVFTPLYLSVIPWFLYDCTLNLVKKQAHRMFFCY